MFDFFTGNDYAESSASGDSHYNMIINEDENESDKPSPPQENGAKYIEVIPVHDDDNDFTPSR